MLKLLKISGGDPAQRFRQKNIACIDDLLVIYPKGCFWIAATNWLYLEIEDVSILEK